MRYTPQAAESDSLIMILICTSSNDQRKYLPTNHIRDHQPTLMEAESEVIFNSSHDNSLFWATLCNSSEGLRQEFIIIQPVPEPPQRCFPLKTIKNYIKKHFIVLPETIHNMTIHNMNAAAKCCSQLLSGGFKNEREAWVWLPARWVLQTVKSFLLCNVCIFTSQSSTAQLICIASPNRKYHVICVC